jgi:hypothetical protein
MGSACFRSRPHIINEDHAMIQFELWMFPIMVGVMVFVANRIVMWRLNASEKRWLREHGDKGHQTPAE